MSERHFKSDPATELEIESARRDIQMAIAEAAKVVDIKAAKSLVAVAGTATTVAAAALQLSQYDRYAIHLSRISAEQTAQVSEMFLKMNREERAALGYIATR